MDTSSPSSLSFGAFYSQEPRFHVSGAIQGVLGDATGKYPLEITKKLPNYPWQAIVRTHTPLTSQQLRDFHDDHQFDVDKAGVPYYFLVHDVLTKNRWVWYSDDDQPMPLNDPERFAAAQQAGIQKGLRPEHVDFVGQPPEN